MGDNDSELGGQATQRRKLHYLYLATGWFFTGLGFVGAFLPVLPTTPFLLIAAWAFSKSSKRLHMWLHEHPRFGSHLVAWDKYRAIPKSGKILSVTMMTLSWTYTYLKSNDWVAPTILGIILLSVGTYIMTRPSAPPAAGVTPGVENDGPECPKSKDVD